MRFGKHRGRNVKALFYYIEFDSGVRAGFFKCLGVGPGNWDFRFLCFAVGRRAV